MHRVVRIRLLIWVIVVVTFFDALLFTLSGLHKTYLGARALLLQVSGEAGANDRPGLLLAYSLENFLIALIFILFSLGIAGLFLPEKDRAAMMHKLPAWTGIHDLQGLKYMLWDAVLTTLVIFTISEVMQREGPLSWDLLVLPVTIAVLGGTRWLLGRGH